MKPLKPTSSFFASFLGENMRAIATTQGRSRSPWRAGYLDEKRVSKLASNSGTLGKRV
jgi:hypothetical protein